MLSRYVLDWLKKIHFLTPVYVRFWHMWSDEELICALGRGLICGFEWRVARARKEYLAFCLDICSSKIFEALHIYARAQSSEQSIYCDGWLKCFESKIYGRSLHTTTMVASEHLFRHFIQKTASMSSQLLQGHQSWLRTLQSRVAEINALKTVPT